MESSIIVFPEFDELKEEISKLRTELSMLLLERDNLKYTECKNIEMQYMLAIGGLEYKAFELNVEMLRLKRKLELIQAKINRQEKIIVNEVEHQLDYEFEKYKAQLDEHIEKMNTAIERSKGKLLTIEEAKELKALYRAIVKALHPDIHPDISEAKLRLFHNSVEAYEHGDLAGLRLIKEMIDEPKDIEKSDTGLATLVKEKERLKKNMEQIKHQLDEIKNTYPYTLRTFVENEEAINEKKTEIEETIKAINDNIISYNERIEQMLKANIY